MLKHKHLKYAPLLTIFTQHLANANHSSCFTFADSELIGYDEEVSTMAHFSDRSNINSFHSFNQDYNANLQVCTNK